MRNRLIKKLVITNEEMVQLMDLIEGDTNNVIIPQLTTMIEVVGKNSDTLVSGAGFSYLKAKTDAEVYKRVISLVKNYISAMGTFRTTVMDKLPDNISTMSDNLNVKLALGYISTGIYFIRVIPIVLNTVMTNIYGEKDTVLSDDIARRNVNTTIEFFNKLPDLEKVNYTKTVNTIGNIPVIKTMRNTSNIPTDVVMGFFEKEFKITSFYTKTFISNILNWFNTNEQTSGKGFIYNPLYHLRLLIVDIEMMRLDAHKEQRRLLELRILELRSKMNGTAVDAKIKKSIEFYENKLNKLDLKINKYMEN